MIYRAPVLEEPPPPEPREVVTLTVSGRTHELTTPRVILGRSRECDLRIADVNVSRRHSEVRQEGPEHWVADLGSTNGTIVNGKRVDRARLENGDVITLGSTEIVFGRALR
jgi:pSer/pThr/pTyr-binding forkhead associated (FHA) protein